MEEAQYVLKSLIDRLQNDGLTAAQRKNLSHESFMTITNEAIYAACKEVMLLGTPTNGITFNEQTKMFSATFEYSYVEEQIGEFPTFDMAIMARNVAIGSSRPKRWSAGNSLAESREEAIAAVKYNYPNESGAIVVSKKISSSVWVKNDYPREVRWTSEDIQNHPVHEYPTAGRIWFHNSPTYPHWRASVRYGGRDKSAMSHKILEEAECVVKLVLEQLQQDGMTEAQRKKLSLEKFHKITNEAVIAASKAIELRGKPTNGITFNEETKMFSVSFECNGVEEHIGEFATFEIAIMARNVAIGATRPSWQYIVKSAPDAIKEAIATVRRNYPNALGAIPVIKKRSSSSLVAAAEAPAARSATAHKSSTRRSYRRIVDKKEHQNQEEPVIPKRKRIVEEKEHQNQEEQVIPERKRCRPASSPITTTKRSSSSSSRTKTASLEDKKPPSFHPEGTRNVNSGTESKPFNISGSRPLLDSIDTATTGGIVKKWHKLQVGTQLSMYSLDDNKYYDATITQQFQSSGIFALQYKRDGSTESLDFETVNENTFDILENNDNTNNRVGRSQIERNSNSSAHENPKTMASSLGKKLSRPSRQKKAKQIKNHYSERRFIFPVRIQKWVVKRLQEELKVKLLHSKNFDPGYEEQEMKEYHNDIHEIIKRIISQVEKGHTLSEIFNDFTEIVELSMDMIDEFDEEEVKQILIQVHDHFVCSYHAYQKKEQTRLRKYFC